MQFWWNWLYWSSKAPTIQRSFQTDGRARLLAAVHHAPPWKAEEILIHQDLLRITIGYGRFDFGLSMGSFGNSTSLELEESLFPPFFLDEKKIFFLCCRYMGGEPSPQKRAIVFPGKVELRRLGMKNSLPPVGLSEESLPFVVPLVWEVMDWYIPLSSGPV